MTEFAFGSELLPERVYRDVGNASDDRPKARVDVTGCHVHLEAMEWVVQKVKSATHPIWPEDIVALLDEAVQGDRRGCELAALQISLDLDSLYGPKRLPKVLDCSSILIRQMQSAFEEIAFGPGRND